MNDREEKILRYLTQILGAELSLDSELLESGLMDSFKALTVIGFLESEFDFRVDPVDLALLDFATPAAIARFVEQVQARFCASVQPK